MSHKQKTTAEEKIRVVRACLSGELANGKLHSKPKYPQERLGTGSTNTRQKEKGHFSLVQTTGFIRQRLRPKRYTATCMEKAVCEIFV
mgnify:CR=1 FL=1